MSDYLFKRLDEEGHPYAVRHVSDPEAETPLGFVWKGDRDRWEAIVASSGERANNFTARSRAADWVWGRWSVTEGPVAKHIPDDPYAGLPGA